MTSPDHNRHILVVDDDAIILVALRETLEQEGYSVVTANSAQEGLAKLETQEFAVIISDQRMPEMTGLEFLSEVKKRQAGASRILITGVLTLNTIIAAVNKGEIYRFLAKPWMREELLATVHNAHQRFLLAEVNRRLQEDTLRLNEELAATNSRLEEHLRELRQTHEELDHAHFILGRNFDHSLELCQRLIEAYHPLLGRETKAVVELCQRLIESGGFSPEQAHILKVSAWLHKIGLIGVHRELIQKFRSDPESLTDVERKQMEDAPVFAQSLASFVEGLREVGITIRAQYERWDGRGYPDGLAGDLIPPTARHLAIAVSYVECGLPREQALEAIVQLSGAAFEPEAVRLFLKANSPQRLPKTIREVLFAELQPGMTLVQDLYSASGLLLLPAGRNLDERTLHKIRDYNFINPITQRILVYN